MAGQKDSENSRPVTEERTSMSNVCCCCLDATKGLVSLLHPGVDGGMDGGMDGWVGCWMEGWMIDW